MGPDAVYLLGVLNFNHLYYFHVTATEGSVKAAAERLGVTQPTVSEQIRMLERALGVQLFERIKTGLRLTQQGREALEHTSAMFLAGERLVEAIGSGVPPTVSLRIGVSAAMSRTIATDFLMPVLTVERCRPSIQIGDFNVLVRDLRAQELDLVIGETEPTEIARPGLDVAILHRPALVAVVHPDLEPRPDWENLGILEYRSSSVYHWEVEAFLRENGLSPTSMGEVDDAFLMLEAVARGGFIAFVPRMVARESIALGRVKVVTTFLPKSAAIHALYPASESSELARAAVEKLVANARDRFDDPAAT